MSDFLLSMNINVPNEDNLRFISPLFCIQVPSFHSHWFVVKEQICHGRKWLPRLLSYVYQEKRLSLSPVEVWGFFFFFVILKRFFSWVSVMQKLSRCVWVLIRCGEPILLFCSEEGTKGISDFMRRGGQQINTQPAKQVFVFGPRSTIIYLIAFSSWSYPFRNIFVKTNRSECSQGRIV